MLGTHTLAANKILFTTPHGFLYTQKPKGLFSIHLRNRKIFLEKLAFRKAWTAKNQVDKI